MRKGIGRLSESLGRFHIFGSGGQMLRPGDPGTDDHLPDERQESLVGAGDLGQDRGGFSTAARAVGRSDSWVR